MTAPEQDPYLTPTEVAALFKVPLSRVRAAVRERKITAATVGRRTVIRQSQAMAWMKGMEKRGRTA